MVCTLQNKPPFSASTVGATTCGSVLYLINIGALGVFLGICGKGDRYELKKYNAQQSYFLYYLGPDILHQYIIYIIVSLVVK